jgi:peptidoglycan/LPS O-acetylase OafA/YrhL
MNARVPAAGELAGEPVRAPSRVVYPALDGVRGIAILLVMLHNLTILEHRESFAGKLWVFGTDAGWIGVQLFFVLSGFLITGILLDERGQPRFFRDFYIRRIVRIFPLYYLVLFVRFAILPRFLPDTAVPVELAIGFWLYVSNWTDLVTHGVNGFGHFWSLAVEEQFYLAWPLAVARLGARGLAWGCGALIALSGIARLVIYARGVNPQWLYMSTITRADALAFGALVAIAIREVRARAVLVRYHRQVGAAAAVALVAIMAYAHGLSRYQTFVETAGYAILAILFAAGIARIVLDDTRTRPRWAMNTVLRAAGKYSYAAYVFHPLIKVSFLYCARSWLVAHGTLELWWMDLGFVATCIALSFVMARLSYAVLEGPLLRLKERWAPRAARA